MSLLKPVLWVRALYSGYLGRVLGCPLVGSPGAHQDMGGMGQGYLCPPISLPHAAHTLQSQACSSGLGPREGRSLCPQLMSWASFCKVSNATPQLSCFPLALTPFRASEASSRSNEHHQMQTKKANQKAWGKQMACLRSDHECVALLETVQQPPPRSPSPCVLDLRQLSSKFHAKSQHQS